VGRPHHLVLNVAELLRRPGTEKEMDLACTTDELDVHDERLVDGPVDVDLRLDVLTDGIVVSGTVSAAWTGQCRRCLAEVGGPLTVPIHELYQIVLTDPDAFPIVQDQIDLTPMLREALLLEVPAAPLCRADCAGLCPVCGTDRNERVCDCDTTVRDERWAALDALKPESGR